MDDWEQDLIAIERELASGDGETYRRHLRADAVLIVPDRASSIT